MNLKFLNILLCLHFYIPLYNYIINILITKSLESRVKVILMLILVLNYCDHRILTYNYEYRHLEIFIYQSILYL